MQIKNTALHGTSQSNVNASPWLSIAGNQWHTVTRYIKSELGFPPKTKTHSALVPYYCCQKRASRLFPLLPPMIEPQSHLGSTSQGDFGTMSVCSFLTGFEAKRSCGTGLYHVVGPLGITQMRPAGGISQSSSTMLASSFN